MSYYYYNTQIMESRILCSVGADGAKLYLFSPTSNKYDEREGLKAENDIHTHKNEVCETVRETHYF